MELFMETWNDPMGQQGIILGIAILLFFGCLFRVFIPIVDMATDGCLTLIELSADCVRRLLGLDKPTPEKEAR